MLALARQGYRAIAYDRRGHGRSADPGRGYDHDTLAADLAAVIDGLNLDGVTIVAHSMGGTEVARSEERRVGKECVSTCRSRWSPDHSKKNIEKLHMHENSDNKLHTA